MSPQIYGCVICGLDIRDRGTFSRKWLKEFRAIYSTPDGGHFISGVGSYDDVYDLMEAPTDSTKRFDDEDYDSQAKFLVSPSMYWEGSHSFPCHAACWNLLGEAFKPKDVPLKRLIEVYDSLPFDHKRFDWGHSYGGTFARKSDPASPWRYRNSEVTTLDHYSEDPCNVPLLCRLLASTFHEPVNAGVPHQNRGANDCFGRLPTEIRQEIATYLPTRDALTLRESSRAFHFLLDSSVFWASRFLLGAERGFLFEKRKAAEPRDWLSLYRMTGHSQCPPGLKSRRRIWSLIEYIVQLVHLQLTEVGRHTTPYDPFHNNKAMVITATADIRKPPVLPAMGSEDPTYTVIPEGCQAFQSQSGSIPRDLAAVALFFAGIGDHGYLSGICFKSNRGADTQLGYSSTASMTLFKAKSLKGFILAIDPMGIRALQIVESNGERSQWFGFPKTSPVTERLHEFDTTAEIQVMIDGYKLVGMSVIDPGQYHHTKIFPSLRTTALWYPSVPGPEKLLNESSFMKLCPSSDKYSPLTWVHFGGPRGKHLRHLVGISLGANNASGIPLTISFSFEEEWIGKARLGNDEKSKIISMAPNSINGPRGEYIKTVQAASRQSQCSGPRIICALKFTTNDRRTFKCGSLAASHRPPTKRPAAAKFITIKHDPATTITSLYAAQDSGGFTCFGVVSEAIEAA